MIIGGVQKFERICLPAPIVAAEPEADPDIFKMPYTLILRVHGFEHLPEERIALLERKLTETYYHAPGRLNGIITIYADMFGDIGIQALKTQMLIFQLRQLIFSGLNFDLEINYRG